MHKTVFHKKLWTVKSCLEAGREWQRSRTILGQDWGERPCPVSCLTSLASAHYMLTAVSPHHPRIQTLSMSAGLKTAFLSHTPHCLPTFLHAGFACVWVCVPASARSLSGYASLNQGWFKAEKESDAMIMWQVEHQVSGCDRHKDRSMKFRFGRGWDQVTFEIEVQ